MRRILLFLALATSGCWLGQQAAAQSVPLKGMVWEVPDSPEQAAADLVEMRQMGVEAVRTGLVRQPRLLDLADTLGLQLFQELPFDDLSAAHLADTLEVALRLLELVVAESTEHPSARHFGLARRADTSDPRACAFFEQLAQRVRRMAGGRAYYVSAFIEADRCAGAVDFVLLDARDAPDPARLPARWAAAHPSRAGGRVGVGALGVWVRAAGTPGLRAPHSPERQARYLETHLNAFLTGASELRAVFVERWRDVREATPSPSRDLARPYERTYGVYASDGRVRPAHAVIRGIYTGEQTVFAFPMGRTPAQRVPWALLAGWLVFLLVAGSYALSPRFRNMAPRYFLAHAFYRESIREGREVLLGASLALLVALAFSVGVLGSVFIEVVRTRAAFHLLFRSLPEPAQGLGVALMAQPWMLVLLLGSVYALSVALWTSALSFASRRRLPLMPGQALMLVLWARWPYLLLLVGAMVTPALPDALALPVVLALAGGWVLATLYALGRTLADYAAVTRLPASRVAALGLVNPAAPLAVACSLLLLDLGPTLVFAWHLATRS